MHRLSCIVVALICFATTALAQDLTQTVRGTIVDADNQQPLFGAGIIIPGSDPLVGTTTDFDGNFRLEQVPVGRVQLQVSFVGYETKTIANLVVNSGKEVVLNLELQESVMKMKELVIRATENKGEALNEMALISARSISAEETSRHAGGFNDPSRIVSNFAGVANTGDGGNDIIVRGNAPKYVQWRLEGIQISNPNHFADQNSAGGAISTLNNNLLSTSDFYTGAFAPEYGDVLSGVYDVKLRAGNNERFESTFGFGLLGTDITVEGPFKEGYGGSYLVNYRYSTASMISKLGLIDVSGTPNFQDAAFKVVLPTKSAGRFSVFGLGGLSNMKLEDVTPALMNTPGDAGQQDNVQEDFRKRSYLGNVGINHTVNVSQKGLLKTTLLYSTEGLNDETFLWDRFEVMGDDGELQDSLSNRNLNFSSRLRKNTWRGASTLQLKLNARHKLQVGTKYALFGYDNNQSMPLNGTQERFTLIDFKENASTIRNFASWKFRVNEDLTLVSGIHNMNVLLNGKSTVEPRVAMNWKVGNKSSIHAGYGKHSTMESIHNYFARVPDANGNVTTPNQNLDLLKAHHFVVGYQKRLSENMVAKLEAYYQHLYNLPVENLDTSYYATINEGLEFRYVDLVNEGTGRNYGVEFTLERFFNNNYYYLVNGSVFQSKYTALDGVERNTQYNGNYIVNVLAGKEFTGLGKKENQTLGLNAKVFVGGGKRILSLLRDDNGEVAVDAENGQFWDYENAYENKIEDLYQIIVSASYKWNRPEATHELFINLDNLTNNKGKISEFYDSREPGNVGYLTQFGFFPNLMYRVYF